MAEWSRKKVNSGNINNGKEYEKDDNVVREQLNAMVNTGLYSQDFAEKLVTNIDTSEVGNVGTPSVSLITGDGATTDKPYKKFKFSNLKGDTGVTPNITVTATTLPAGSSATVTKSGTAENPVFTFSIPKGQDGLDGSGINPNLLINGDFRVNQRGQTSYVCQSKLAYTVDRWAYIGGNIEVLDNGIKLTNTRTETTNAYFEQFIEDYSKLLGKTITISYCLSDGTIVSKSGKLPDVEPSTSQNLLSTNIVQNTDGRLYYFNTKKLAFTIDILKQVGTTGIIILWAKLEIGDTPTAYSPRPYAEELAMCQRYYEKIDISNISNKYQIRLWARSAYYFYDGKIPFAVEKRTTPTVKVFSQNTDTSNYLYNSTQSKDVEVSTSYQTTKNFLVSISSGDVAINDVCNGYFEADAEIY